MQSFILCLLFSLLLCRIGAFNVVQIYEPVYENGFVVFKVEVEGAVSLFLAGSFNSYASNYKGYVQDMKYSFDSLSESTYIRRELLIPGQYSVRIVIDNEHWITIPGFPTDSEGNTVIFVSDSAISKQPVIIDTPHWSFNDLPFSNGISASKFNIRSKQIDSLTNHIYKQKNEHDVTQSLFSALDFTFTINNATKQNWLSYLTVNIPQISYLDHSGIVVVAYSDEGNHPILASFFSSFLETHGNLNIVLQTMGKNYQFASQIQWNPLANVSQVSDGVYTSAMGNIYVTEQNVDGYYACTIDIGEMKTRSGSPIMLLQNEINWWNNWHSDSVLPEITFTDEQKHLYLQSLAILKMSQCRETTDNSYGQMLASFPPGAWNICWIRDAAYAMNGLIYGGHLQEAKDGLSFFLNAKVGTYVNWVIDDYDYGVRVPYQISVCRYYGDGTEWSDGDADPNIELDGFGLFLWALENYITVSKDTQLLIEYWESVIKPKIADVLIYTSNNQYNAIQKDSSIWERHLVHTGEDGARHFTYTTLTAIRGLKAAAALAELINDESAAKLYLQTSKDLTSGFLQHQVDKKRMVIRDSIEDTEITQYIDASVIEAVNWGIIDVQEQGTLITNTLTAFDLLLSMKNRPHGYFRNRGGHPYDSQEWIVMDLRIARSLKKLNQTEKSAEIMNWVISQSAENFNIMAELYDVNMANYVGAVPMCGFGPGAFIIYYWDQ
jgi:GH15 family glucan-1,4-alpha-glucosidase